MNLVSVDYTKDSITLVTDIAVTGVPVLYDRKLATGYATSQVASTTVIITKEELGLDSLNNNFYQIDLDGASSLSTAVYNINVLNENEANDYDAADLKNGLDNLNFYDNTIERLVTEEDFLSASSLFFRFLDYLTESKNANNLTKIFSG